MKDEEIMSQTIMEYPSHLIDEHVASNKGQLQRQFQRLTPTEQGEPLEFSIKSIMNFISKNFGLETIDLTPKRYFQKGEHEVDFLIPQWAVTEAKNWNSCTPNGYTIELKDVDNQVLPKYEKYPKQIMRLLVIANPVWGIGVKEYLQSKGVLVIELGFQVVNTKESIDKAFYALLPKILDILIPSIELIDIENEASNSSRLHLDVYTNNILFSRSIQRSFTSSIINSGIQSSKTDKTQLSAEKPSEKTNSESQLPKDDSVEWSLHGFPISDETVAAFWNTLKPAKPIPTISAYIVSQEELISIMETLYKIIVSHGLTPKGIIWEWGRWNKPDEVYAFVMPLSANRDSFLIVIGMKSFEDVREDLIHELRHIHQDDWLKFKEVD